MADCVRKSGPDYGVRALGSANGDAGDKPRLDKISKKLNLDRYIELITGPHHSG